MVSEGYPQFVILLVLGIGIPLAILRPYKAFLLAVLLLTAGNAATFNQTRTSLLGPYLNLGDACLLVALVALFFDKFRSKGPVWLPAVVPVLLFVLTIAACQSFWKLGWTYETARAYRWGLEVPLAFLIGANLVTSTARAKKLLAAVLCGVILSAVQHLFFASTVWRSRSLNMQTYHMMRTIAYWGGCMSSAFLVTGVIWKLPANIWKKIPFLIVGVLFLTSVVMNQTRSLWLATAGAVLCLLILFQKGNHMIGILRAGVIVVLLVFITGLVCHCLAPELDVFKIVGDKLSLLAEEDPIQAYTATRINQFNVEMDKWLEGTLVLGRGLSFFQTIRNPKVDRSHIAFGHLGYVTYLSQMGLIGLFAYGFYLPLVVARDGRCLWRHGDLPVLRYIGLLGAASIICLSIMFMMSSSFLGLGYSAPGVLYGSVWSLARTAKNGDEKQCRNVRATGVMTECNFPE
jgi:hypothetical protein